MILSDKEIRNQIGLRNIVIQPFNPACLGSNSYDVHLSPFLATYVDEVLDCAKSHELKHFTIEREGYVLQPGKLYLGSTVEYTETHAHVPFLEGKSSIGRLGIDIHATAGKGDVGFCNHWTLEISVTHPVRVYPGMKIGQLIYFSVVDTVDVPYYAKEDAKYTERDPKPQGSRMYLNWPKLHSIGSD